MQETDQVMKEHKDEDSVAPVYHKFPVREENQTCPWKLKVQNLYQ